MKVTSKTLRRLIREEYMRLLEDASTDSIRNFYAINFKSEAEMQSAKKKLAMDLKNQGVLGQDAIASKLQASGHGDDSALSFAAELSQMQK